LVVRLAPRAIVGLAGLYWIFNVVWFWRYCGRNINADAISYIGIARHITEGNFRASLHGYWSPLISWLIAATSFISSDRTLAARVLMLPLLAASLALVYRLTHKLWGSRLLSAIAVLWFATARSISVFSICFIGADLLLTAIMLVYFTQLLECLEQPERASRWFGLGMAHAVAFLAKAIAMPLLAFTTLTAVAWTLRKSPRRAATALLCAAAVPALVWASWGIALRAKYGVFTTGYQLHWNLIDPEWNAAQATGHGMLVLHDHRGTYDSYMVSDVMSPGSPLWKVKVWRGDVLRRIVHKELTNVPVAGKELLVLLTPGGLLALLLCAIQLSREHRRFQARFQFAWIVTFATAALVAAYCMLVFDGRYVIPIAPVLIALAVRFVLPAGWVKDLPQPKEELSSPANVWRTAAAAVLLIGLIGVQVYWASPFRTMGQDFQRSVHDSAGILKAAGARTLVVIGIGPYPEHGVGWEAGMYAAYFAEAVVLGDTPDLPTTGNVDSVVADTGKLNSDAVMVWGTTSDPGYSSVITALLKTHPKSTASVIRDPRRGEVGTVLSLRNEPKF